MKSPSLAALSAVLVVPVLGQGGDDCANPTLLTVPGSYAFDTTSATTSGFAGSTTCSAFTTTLKSDLFWVFIAPSSGRFVVDTVGTEFAANLEIYAGGDCGAPCVIPGLTRPGQYVQKILQASTAGQEFLIQVGGPNVAFGRGLLNVTQPVLVQGGDDCSAPTPLGLGVVDFNTALSTTSTFDLGGSCSSASPTSRTNDQFWEFVAPADGSYRVCATSTAFLARLAVFEGSGCAATCLGRDFTNGAAQTQRIVALPDASAGDRFLIRVGGGAGTGMLRIDPVATGRFGDACGAPTVVGQGLLEFDTTGATTSGFPGQGACQVIAAPYERDAFFVLRAPVDGTYSYSTIGTGFQSHFVQYDGGDCAALCIGGSQQRRGEFGELGFLAAGEERLIQIGGGATLGAGQVASGVGTLSLSYRTCVGLVDDALEDNDDCASAVRVTNGTYPDLNASIDDNDFYAVRVEPGATLRVELAFRGGDGNLDLHLWDPSGPCGTAVAGTGPSTGSLASGLSVSDDESITYTNSGAAALELVFEVDLRESLRFGYCGSYDMFVAGASDPRAVVYCEPAVPNSSGNSATLRLVGTTVVAADDVTLVAEGLPANQMGYLLVAPLQASVASPGGSSGVLCLGGAIGRFIAQAQSSGPLGSFPTDVGLAMLPRPNSNAVVQPGETWNFQVWFRDTANGTLTSNFTHGLALTFL